MLDVHIDDFWKDCAAILIIGMRRFPASQTLYIEDISGPDEVDEYGLHSNRHLAALGAVQWLKAEGYIRFSTIDRQESVDEFALTAKAFTRLISLDENNTAVFQTLEYALLQADTTWLGSLVKQYILAI